eukprot:1492179-Karenia_brevis.AAC.1
MLESVVAGVVDNKLLRSLDSNLVQVIGRGMMAEFAKRWPDLSKGVGPKCLPSLGGGVGRGGVLVHVRSIIHHSRLR